MFRMTSSTRREIVGRLDESIDIALMEADFRKDKAKAKLNFIRSLNYLVSMVKYQEVSSCREVLDAFHNLDVCMESVFEILSNLTTFYIQNKELQKSNLIVGEMEKIETDFYTSYDIAWAYLDSRVDAKSCALSESRERRNTEATENEKKRRMEITTNRATCNVGTLDQNSMCESNHSTAATTPCLSTNQTLQTSNRFEHRPVAHEQPNQSAGAEQT